MVSIGLFVKIDLGYFCQEWTSCVKKQSADIVNKEWLMTNGYLYLDIDSVSQPISEKIKVTCTTDKGIRISGCYISDGIKQVLCIRYISIWWSVYTNDY